MQPPEPGTKMNLVYLEEDHLFWGVRYFVGENVVPADMIVRKGRVLEEDTKKPYKMPEQKMELITDIASVIAPNKRVADGKPTPDPKQVLTGKQEEEEEPEEEDEKE